LMSKTLINLYIMNWYG